jgi:hypothetical protein
VNEGHESITAAFTTGEFADLLASGTMNCAGFIGPTPTQMLDGTQV